MSETFEAALELKEAMRQLEQTIHGVRVTLEDLTCIVRILADAYLGTLPGIVADQTDERNRLLQALRTQFVFVNDLGEKLG